MGATNAIIQPFKLLLEMTSKSVSTPNQQAASSLVESLDSVLKLQGASQAEISEMPCSKPQSSPSKFGMGDVDCAKHCLFRKLHRVDPVRRLLFFPTLKIPHNPPNWSRLKPDNQ
jgi:hypothetical protein